MSDEMSDDEALQVAAAMAGRWEDKDGDLWDVYLSPTQGLVARSVFNGFERSAHGIIAMGRMVGLLPEGFVGDS